MNTEQLTECHPKHNTYRQASADINDNDKDETLLALDSSTGDGNLLSEAMLDRDDSDAATQIGDFDEGATAARNDVDLDATTSLPAVGNSSQLSCATDPFNPVS